MITNKVIILKPDCSINSYSCGMLSCVVFMVVCLGRPQLLATGDAAGNVAIWRLNSELTQQQNHEQEMLDELADVVHE